MGTNGTVVKLDADLAVPEFNGTVQPINTKKHL